MLDGLFMLLSLSVVMALTSFLAGALPLSMSLSSSQLRFISAIGMGVLVGTSLIVIIPEGIEAVYTSGEAGNLHTRRGHALGEGLEVRWLNGVHTIIKSDTPPMVRSEALHTIKASPEPILHKAGGIVKSSSNENIKMAIAQEATGTTPSTSPPTEPPSKLGEAPSPPQSRPDPSHADDHDDPPTFYIGFSLILGFILMFLIDKLPRHASEHITPPPPTRHISLDNLSQDLHASGDEESESFLQSLAPTPKQSRSLATTTGLVIHAAADGIAMGASASSSNTKLGFIIFVAIMIHKAPAAFGLTSVLLKQGLSKRAARGHLIIFSLAAPFGALTTWLLENILGGDHMEGERGQWWTGMLLLFSAGTFLYVAMHAMQEESANEHSHSNGSSNGYVELGSSVQRKAPKPQMRDTLAAVGGMLIPLLTQLGHHH